MEQLTPAAQWQSDGDEGILTATDVVLLQKNSSVL